MTYKELIKKLGRLTEDQLDGDIIVEVEDCFHNVVDINIASGKGEYLYKDEVFFTINSESLSEKFKL